MHGLFRRDAGRIPPEPSGVQRLVFLAGILSLGALAAPERVSAAGCAATVAANVVALDQPFFYNRLGSYNPAGMIFALKRDVVDKTSGKACTEVGCQPGNVRLRSDKRARPLVLRVNAGQCLKIDFTNLLASTAPVPPAGGEIGLEAPATRTASAHVMGLQPMDIASDGSFVGNNGNSLAAPGQTKTYTYFAEREGAYFMYSTAATTGGAGNGGQISAGLFGAVNVEPAEAEFYRSQVTADDLQLATGGQAPDGHPLIDYNAEYPAGHRWAGLPILKMTKNGEIVHSDLNAIITGPNRGRFAGIYKDTPVNPDRNQPFREFTVIFHDEAITQQPFPQFSDRSLGLVDTLHSVRDGFAINYGSAAAGPEAVANRLGVGPMKDCVECKFEEFFLTSWAVGDPGMLVDVPASANVGPDGKRVAYPFAATQAYYPDDPSNVHHSYLNDHVKIRNIHAGPKEHHIFHLHAHQWVHTPDSDNSAYLDSQAIGPGSAYTYEIAHHGSGNRNKMVGDSIFHCHFYPHFAQGMWALWRTHDVFENGTRKLPDGEIADGTPIPAVVPVPTLAMAPLPDAEVAIVNGQAVVAPLDGQARPGNPGYPFFMADAAKAGHRPPTPPLDIIESGGLPRHIVTDGAPPVQVTNRLSFHKELTSVEATELPEDGTPLEKAAMDFHAQRTHPSYRPDGSPGGFTTNGLPPKPGAPFADPCVSDDGQPAGTDRLYKAALIQLDIRFNKAGWHYPQSRILSLWDDVEAYLNGAKAPEPLFFRANTNDCITFWHTNYVPGEYRQDDFQITTPTDVIGQHIHLVKFDVTSSDGSGNGFNYEDGTFSPDEVHERIKAINQGLWTPANTGQPVANAGLAARPGGPQGMPGARTTVQRWFVDDTMNRSGKDRTLRSVFTHDHFGPSTHQQAGLYATLVVEPQGSTWRDPETGQTFGGRGDGGPTSWRADILAGPGGKDSYREFMLEFQDYALAYTAADDPLRPNAPINPPARNENAQFGLVQATVCHDGQPAPCPEGISASDVGTMTVNYRNEPLALRVGSPNAYSQASGAQGDLSKAYLSIKRADDRLNRLGPISGNDYAARPDVGVYDPFTPMMRAYEFDKVQVRTLVGATEDGHNFTIHDQKWLFEPSEPNSGYRNSQMMGLSEHYEFVLPPIAVKGTTPAVDYLYKPGASVDDQWNGLWGVLRAYNGGLGLLSNLKPLPNNPNGKAPPPKDSKSNPFSGVCPKNAPARNLGVTAVAAQQALPEKSLVYNDRKSTKLHDPSAILYVRSGDLYLDKTANTYKLKPGVPIEPLVLRANAGDCINLTLTNRLPAEPLPNPPGWFILPMIKAGPSAGFNANQLRPSNEVGLHPQLLFYDASSGNDGANVGLNGLDQTRTSTGVASNGTILGPLATAPPNGGIVKYKWYAGNYDVLPDGTRIATPVEFGATNLLSSDPIMHPNKGAIGALIIEPAGAAWTEDATSRASADIKSASGSLLFREFVLMFQSNLSLRHGTTLSAGDPAVPLTAEAEEPEDSGQKAFNYRSEPMWYRMGYAADQPLDNTQGLDYTAALSGAMATPTFTAKAGTPVRFRVLHPGGVSRNHVFQLHGHVWEEEPYTDNSTKIGHNPLSEWYGSQYGIGASSHFDILPQHGAGGAGGVKGDFLYRDQSSFGFDEGLMGIFRVE